MSNVFAAVMAVFIWPFSVVYRKLKPAIAPVIMLVSAIALSSCGSSGSSTPADSDTLKSTSSYRVELVTPDMGLTNGKARFQLKITDKSSGLPVTGLASAVTLNPVMEMSTMSHGTAVPPDAVQESSTAGTYDCTVYFVMASVDASGMSMGTWNLNVAVNGEEVTFTPAVQMYMGTDTQRIILRSNDDMTMGTDGTMSARWYHVYNAGLVPGETHGSAFTVYIAAQEEGLMHFPAITAGTQLLGMDGAVQKTIDSLLVEISADGAEWDPMTCSSNGQCEGHMHHAYSAGEQATAYIRVTINGVTYTTDGGAANNSSDPASNNANAVFTATMAGSGM
ncbi:MAG: hypothetical protein HZB29_04010 [Nitrospinae bacterium]|nr:hypothetical protein [Nitrospinota bacterium]